MKILRLLLIIVLTCPAFAQIVDFDPDTPAEQIVGDINIIPDIIAGNYDHDIIHLTGVVDRLGTNRRGSVKREYWVKSSGDGEIRVRSSGASPEVGQTLKIKGYVNLDRGPSGVSRFINEVDRAVISENTDDDDGNQESGGLSSLVIILLAALFVLNLFLVFYILYRIFYVTVDPPWPPPPPLDFLPAGLRVLNGEDRGRFITFKKSPSDTSVEYTVGRTHKVWSYKHITLDDNTVSHQQAAIHFDGENWSIQNLADPVESNATVVNGRSMVQYETFDLKDGYSIEFGRVKTIFVQY